MLDYGALLFGQDWADEVTGTGNMETAEVILRLDCAARADPRIGPKVSDVFAKRKRTEKQKAKGCEVTHHPEDHHLRLAIRNGGKEPRLPNTTNIAFDFIEAEAVLTRLDLLGICASSGSACTTGSLDPSHVLSAMGLSPMRARGSVRFSLGIYNTDEDVDYLIGQLPKIVQQLREISPLNPEHPDNDRYDIDAARKKHEEEMASVKE